MTTVSPPFSQGQTQTDLGFDRVYLEAQIRMGLAERLNLLGLDRIVSVGDLAGSGSDTASLPYVDGMGYDAAMTSLGTESSPVPIGTATTGYDTIALGEYGLGYEVTYRGIGLGRDASAPVLDVDRIADMLPDSFAKTFRSVACTTGATISASVGSTSTNASMDDLLDLMAAADQTDGVGEDEALTLMLKPIQLSQLKDSARSEPAFQNSLADFSRAQARGRVIPGAFGLNVDIVATSDVTDTGGAYQGFAFQRPALGYVTMDTERIAPNVPYIAIPEFGLLIQFLLDKAGQATKQVEGRAYFGIGLASTTVAFQRRFLSTT